MNHPIFFRKILPGFLAALASAVFAGCIFEVPITLTPTRKVDEKLLGNWVSVKGREKMNVRKLDESVYIISYDGELYRAFHSDVDGVPFISAQDLNRKERKYTYVSYRLADDGERLTLRLVNPDVISAETQSVADVQARLRQEADNQELFTDEPVEFAKEKEDAP